MVDFSLFEAAQLSNPAKTLFELAHHSLLARGHRNGIRIRSVIVIAETPDGCDFTVEMGPPPESQIKAKTMKGKIFDLLTSLGRPLKGMAIARRIGVKNNGHFRGALSDLVKAGKIERSDLGYVPGRNQSLSDHFRAAETPMATVKTCTVSESQPIMEGTPMGTT